ncbi:MAG: histidine kinase [Collinsella sp.]|nr:histidine kinase [Collinsella sp.]
MSAARRGGRHSRALPPDTAQLYRLLSILCSLLLMGCLVFALFMGDRPELTFYMILLLCVLLMVFVYLFMNPDTLRSQYAEQTLSIASDMLEDIRGGLTPESARAVCRRLLPQTNAVTVAVTDCERVLACEGAFAGRFPVGAPISTPATRYAIEHGLVQSFVNSPHIFNWRDPHDGIPAGIIAPLKVRGVSVGTLKFFFGSHRAVNRTQYALVSGYAELISTQLNIHELERQDDLIARAELRALQAQINPHFLFNTLNTIASLTRTEPLRARELLREFASFYRSTLDNSGSLIPVSREIMQTNRYLMFEKARFGEDRIITTVDVGEDIQDELVPAFIIQPLVENAVRHAMRDEGALHIGIEVQSEGDGALRIRVIDDGSGMDRATAERLFSEAAPIPAPDRVSQSEGAGVATRNISERIKRFYGPRSSVEVDSEPGRGTTITLHLDLQESIFT